MTVRQMEFVTGLLFLVLGVVGLLLSLRYNLMTGPRIGPGAFPAILAGIMILLGLFQTAAAYRTGGASLAPTLRWRPIAMVCLAVAAFGLLVERTGAIPALAVSAVIAGMASGGMNLKHILVVYAGIVLFAYGVVVKLIGMQLPLFWW